MNPETDSTIPQRLWAHWIPAEGPREIVRALTGPERAMLLRRAEELDLGLATGTAVQRDGARSALHAMLGGFRALRGQQGDDADAAVEVLMAVLREFPPWAIEEACLRIARRQADVDPPLDPRWPPNDSQVHAVVQQVVKPYRQVLERVTGLLAAPVERRSQVST